MSGFDGNGVWTRSYSFVQDAANGLKISSSRFDTELANVTAGFNICMTRDGQGKPSAAMDWNGQNLGNVGQLTVMGASTFGGAVTLTGNLSVAGTGTFSAAETVTGALTVVGVSTFGQVTAGAIVSTATLATFSPTTGAQLLLTNPSAIGQSPLDWNVNGALRARLRADYQGNLNYVAIGGVHNWYTGGDLSVGTLRYSISATGQLSRGSAGSVPNFASAAMTGGAIFVQPLGADPTAAPGDIVLEY